MSATKQTTSHTQSTISAESSQLEHSQRFDHLHKHLEQATLQMSACHLTIRKAQLSVSPQSVQEFAFCIYMAEDVLIKFHQGSDLLFLSVYFINEGFDGQTVTVQAETTDDSQTSWADEALTTELFALMYIADVNLHGGSGDTLQGIQYGHAGMCVSSCIEHDTIAVKSHLLYLIDNLAFQIALVIINTNIRHTGAQLLQIIFPGTLTVNLSYSDTK